MKIFIILFTLLVIGIWILGFEAKRYMAPLPKRRHSTRRGGKRQAEWIKAFRLPSLITCPHCSAARLPHRACKSCGWYDGKIVIVKREKTKKK